MGRFSKLETGAAAQPQPEAEEMPRVRKRSRGSREEDLAPATDYDQGHYLAEADKLFYQGDYQKALRHYSRAMQVDHSAVEPWIGQVLCLVELKQFRESGVWALRSLELFPEEPRLISLQGLTYALNGSAQRAISCSDFAMSRPVAASAFVWLVRGQILSLSDNANAAFCFDKAMEVRQKDDWRAPMQIGLLLLREKKWSRAAEFLQIAVQVNARNGFLWKKLAFANERMGLTEPAMEAYNAALHMNPNDAEAEASLNRLSGTALPVRLWRRLFGR